MSEGAARRLEGRPAAEAVWQRVQHSATTFLERSGRAACLVVVSGVDAAAGSYARQIERQFGRRGLSVRIEPPPPDASVLSSLLDRASSDGAVDGVLVLSPLAEGINLQTAMRHLDPRKDVDGQHPENLGLLAQRRPAMAPATALGGLRLLEHYAVPLSGTRTVVVGRSPVVGLPLALLLLNENATVGICHSRTADLPAVTREADLLCVAVGRRGMIGPEHVRPGAVVLDFGSHPGEDGGFVGDVEIAAVASVAGAITPVPGGTGPMTVAVLAEQTLTAAHAGLGN